MRLTSTQLGNTGIGDGASLARAVRVGLAVFVALAALVSLMTGLGIARGAPAEAPTEPTAQLRGSDEPELVVTKTVEPSGPDTGGLVTITFVISGVTPRPLDVALVQDVSGSMDGQVSPSDPRTRLEASQAAAWDFVSELQPLDQVAVVAFSDVAQLVQPLTTSREAISTAISGLQAGGSTNISHGLEVASTALLTPSARPSNTVKKAMILLTDGQANRPPPAETAGQRALEEAQQAADKGIAIFTIGFGEDADEDLLQDIADVGGGAYYFAPSSEELREAYLSIALQLRDLTIIDQLPPGIDANCPPIPPDWCTENPDGSTTVTWPIGDEDLVAGRPVTVAFPVTVNWDPGESGPINEPDSCVQYYGENGEPKCEPFVNPTITVGGRKVTGLVFEDLDRDGAYNANEEDVLPGVVVTGGAGLTSTTDVSGVYTLRTSAEPTLTVAVEIPPGYISTTSETARIPPLSGIYRRDFGLYTGLIGEKHSLDPVGPPLFEGEELIYTVTVRNISASLHPGVILTDAIPPHISYVNGSAHISPAGVVTVSDGSLTGYVDELPSKDRITLAFRTTVDAGAVGQEISNLALVTSTLQRYRLRLMDEEGPRPVRALPTPLLDLAASARVVESGAEVTYVYTVSNPSPDVALSDVVVTDSHLGIVSPSHFGLPPGELATLTAPVTLHQNRMSTATVSSGVEGYSGAVHGNPATTTVHVLEGIALTQVDVDPLPSYHGDVTTLTYSVVNPDVDDGVVEGSVVIADTLGRTLATTPFGDLGPGGESPPFSQAFSVPRDIEVTLRATALDDVEQSLLVSDQVAVTLCAEDVYERDYDEDALDKTSLPRISVSAPPQVHDFWEAGDEDWLWFERSSSAERRHYTFLAHPLSPAGTAISMTLFDHAGRRVASGTNLGDVTSDVWLYVLLPPRFTSQPLHILDTEDYFLQVTSASGQSGCWTDYELWVKEGQPVDIWLPIVLRGS